VLTLKGHTEMVKSVAFSPDGQSLVSASHDETVKVWDLRRGREMLTLKGHHGPVSSVAFSPDGQRVAAAGHQLPVKVWDARTGQERLSLQGCTCVAYSPDGRRLAAAAARGGAVMVWNAHTGVELFALKGHTMVTGLTFSPDGQYIAAADVNGTVKVWDTRSRRLSVTLRGHPSRVESVAYSPDGRRLATASWDRTVKVWDAQTGQEAITFKGHTGWVEGVAFSPDGQHLASASDDKTVKVWDATLPSEGSDLQRRAISYFRFVAETVGLKDEMIRQIRQTPTLSEPVREQALALARDYREVPARLDAASWSVVRRAWTRPGAYALALRQAEAACRQEPTNADFLRTLGAAQYRGGHHAAALKTLTPTDKPLADAFKDSARVLAFLAMTQFHLGQKAEAAVTLARLRDVMRKLPFDLEADDLLKEAERLVDPKR
jgi:sugar lactone lactonase YvrE